MKPLENRTERHWAHRIPFVGPVAIVRPRWSLSVLVGVIVYFALYRYAGAVRLLGAWDCGSLFFLAATIALAVREAPEDVRRRARVMDEGAVIVLLLTLVGVAASLISIVSATEDLQAFAGSKKLAALLVATTVVLTWLVTQSTFALHYAHMFYGDDDADPSRHTGGLDFPGGRDPDYLDFAYYSFVLGMTFQVSDVEITDRDIRHLSLVHSVISFFFTTVILSLSINLLAGFAHP